MNLENRVRAIVEELREAGLRLTTVLLFEPAEGGAREPRRFGVKQRDDDPWLKVVQTWLAQFDFAARELTMPLILAEALGLERPSKSDRTRVGMVLQQLGFEKRDRGADSRNERFYYQRRDQSAG